MNILSSAENQLQQIVDNFPFEKALSVKKDLQEVVQKIHKGKDELEEQLELFKFVSECVSVITDGEKQCAVVWYDDSPESIERISYGETAAEAIRVAYMANKESKS